MTYNEIIENLETLKILVDGNFEHLKLINKNNLLEHYKNTFTKKDKNAKRAFKLINKNIKYANLVLINFKMKENNCINTDFHKFMKELEVSSLQ